MSTLPFTLNEATQELEHCDRPAVWEDCPCGEEECFTVVCSKCQEQVNDCDEVSLPTEEERNKQDREVQRELNQCAWCESTAPLAPDFLWSVENGVQKPTCNDCWIASRDTEDLWQ